MSKVITVASGKGGVGKTTFCANLGYALADIGKKVLLIELDLGLRSLDIMIGLQDSVVYDLGDVLEDKCSIGQAIVTGNNQNLSIISAPTDFSFNIDPEQFSFLIETVSNDYDYIILDMPAGLNMAASLSPIIADVTVVVTTPDPICIRDGNKLALILSSLGNENLKLVINRVDRKILKKYSIYDLDEVIDGVGIPLLGVIPDDNEFLINSTTGKLLDKSGTPYKIYKNIGHRLEGEYIPLLIE